MSNIKWHKLADKKPTVKGRRYLVHCETKDQKSPLVMICWYLAKFGFSMKRDWLIMPQEFDPEAALWAQVPKPQTGNFKIGDKVLKDATLEIGGEFSDAFQ